MKNFLLKKKKCLVIILAGALVFNFLFLPITALAQPAEQPAPAATAPAAPPTAPAAPKDDSNAGGVVSWLAGKAVLFISSVISTVLGAILGVILFIEAQIIDYMLSPNNFSFTHSPVVELGWGITRDLSNMFLILILLVIAFATVLKIQSYALKQLLWKVVVVALLINFSLVFAGVIIDFAQVMTNFFLKQALGGNTGITGFGTITTRLASSMQILNFYNPAEPDGALAGIGQFGASAIAAVIGIILTLVGLVITVFVFGATAIFLIVRIIYIWFLLITIPIVCVFWILPATQGYFTKWWSAFINWTFFAPVYMFMIYLSLSLFDAQGKLNTKAFWAFSGPGWNTAPPGLSQVGMPSAIFQWILVIAMMFGSLIVAKSFGVMFAGASEKMLTGWGDRTKDWTKGQLRRRVVGAGATPATETEKAKAGWLVRGAQRIAGLPGGRLLAGQAFKMAAGEAKTAEEAQKQFTDWTPEAIKAYLDKQPSRFASPFVQSQRIGAALALKEKGKLDTLNEAQLKDLASLASRSYPKQLDEILKVAPHLATAFKKTIEEIVKKIDKANEVTEESLSHSEVVFNLNPTQLKDIVQKGDIKKVKKIKEAVRYELEALRESGDPVKIEMERNIQAVVDEPRKDQRNKKLKELPEEAAKMARAHFVTSSPAWDI